MTEFLCLLLRGLTAWRLVSARVRAVECLVRCWGEWRCFAQLREGSDDPPPPVRIGASAWADATPRPASIPSRTIVIAKVRRRRETRCMKPKPLHQTPNGTNTACLSKFCLSAPVLHQIAGASGAASRLLDIPRCSPYHLARKQHTRAGGRRSNARRPRLLLSVASLTSASTSSPICLEANRAEYSDEGKRGMTEGTNLIWSPFSTAYPLFYEEWKGQASSQR